jgi:CheY-like chemotaxis protein
MADAQELISQFMHAFATPITAIQGAADILLKSSEALTPGQRKEMAKIISRNARLLDARVGELLGHIQVGGEGLTIDIAPQKDLFKTTIKDFTEEEITPAAVPLRPRIPTTKKILVVDDSADVAYLVCHCLERSGYTVKVGKDGEEGWQLAQEWLPDAVVLDVSMPKLDGWEVLQRIKQDRRLRSTPVIMLTVKASKEDRVKAEELGAAAHLSKPFVARILQETIKKLLKD